MTTKKLLALALALLVLAGGSFLVGATLLVAALAMSNSVESAVGDEPAIGAGDAPPAARQPERRGGFFERLAENFGSGGAEKPSFVGSRPVGLYLMTKYWIATRHLEKAVWYFTGDGRVYFNPTGITAEELAGHEGRQGTAAAAGDTLTVNWRDGSVSSAPLERNGDGFNWDTGMFAPMSSFSDEAHLVGRWEGGTSVSFSGSYAATSQTFEIRADGTFTRDAAATLASEAADPSITAGSSGTTAGRWVLDGYTLTMTYANGEIVRGVAFPFDDAETDVYPDRFYFAGTLFKKL